ncbi:hypothetical protein SEUCBS139899_008268 [Sporothrix eucalyptigena]
MATVTTLSPLERLPHVVLDIICEHLDEQSDQRRDLCAFSLTSRRCRDATDTRRFNQIVLIVPTLDDLGDALDELKAVLGHGQRYGLVHRLKVQGLPFKIPTLPRVNNAEVEKDDEKDEDDDHEEDDDNARSITRNFDGPPFCRLGQQPLRIIKGGNARGDEWLPFASFIRELPALRDLVMSGYVARFHLDSLVYDRNNPRPVSVDDYALVTSPALHSIHANIATFDGNGLLDYTKEAVELMMTGLAPNLTNVWLESRHDGVSLHQDRSIARGRPRWRGFHLNDQTEEEKSLSGGTGLIRNLRLDFYLDPRVLNAQCLENLCHLHVTWTLEKGQALADIAVSGHLSKLEELSLLRVKLSSNASQAAINQIISHTSGLRHLKLEGYFTMETFDLLTHQHGPTLQSLLLNPWTANDDVDYDNNTLEAIFEFSVDTLMRMTKRCPQLEEVRVDLARTEGDHDEVAIYRSLALMPKLKRVVMRLGCWTDKEPHTVDYLKRVFANCAIDAKLARAVFDLIYRDGQGPLEYLRIEPRDGLL